MSLPLVPLTPGSTSLSVTSFGSVSLVGSTPSSFAAQYPSSSLFPSGSLFPSSIAGLTPEVVTSLSLTPR